MKKSRFLPLVAALVGGLQVMSCASKPLDRPPAPRLGLGVAAPDLALQALAGGKVATSAKGLQHHCGAEHGGPPGYKAPQARPAAWPTLTRDGQDFEAVMTDGARTRHLLAAKPTPTPTPSAAPAPAYSLNAKLLVVAADGTEPELGAITQALDYLGTPYEVYIATQSPGGLTAAKLADGNQGHYQGVILTSNGLGVNQNGTYVSALTADEWQALATYEAAFHVRQVDWYVYPTADLGFGSPTPLPVDTTPLPMRLTAAGQAAFPSINPSAVIPIKLSYVYQAPVVDPATVPLMTDPAGNALAVTHTYADGREVLAQTFSNNPWLVHSLATSYGLINWVSRGLFLGERHAYAMPQPDDFFNGNDMYPSQSTTPDPREKVIDPEEGMIFRMNGADLKAFVKWQQGVRAKPLTANFITALPYNGVGTTKEWLQDEGIKGADDLTNEAKKQQAQFGWLSHTFTHPYLDDISYVDCKNELLENIKVADQLHLKLDRTSMVTPNISGLGNLNALQAMYDVGIRYVVSDTSVAGENNPTPNAGIYNALVPAILEIPRRPTNLFYNVSTPDEWVPEYNHLYAAFWGHDVDYNELLDKESDVLLGYLLKGENDPWMFHQPNMRAYDGTHSLLGDLMDRTFAKYAALSTFPITSPTQTELGIREAARMAYNAAGVTATIVPGVSITLTAAKDATVPVTGLKAGTIETYNGASIGWVSLRAGQSVTYPLK